MIVVVIYHIVAFALLALVVLMAGVLGMPLYSLMTDPAAISRTSAAVGFLSNLGVITSAGGAAVALFSAFVHHRMGSEPAHRGLLAAVGGLTVVITLDDLCMLHERILPTWLGLPGDLTAPLYGIAVVLIAWRWREILPQTGLPIPLSALLWLGISAGIDSAILPAPSVSPIYEDGAKFVGQFGWSVWIGYFAARSVTGFRGVTPAAE